MSLKKPRATQLEKSRVWVYFTKCDGYETERVRCNLCSNELTINKVQNTKTILWNHIKFKHSINKNDKNIDEIIYDDDIIYDHIDHYNALSYNTKRKISPITSAANKNNNNNSALQPNNNNNTKVQQATDNNISDMTPKLASRTAANGKVANSQKDKTNKPKSALDQKDLINELILGYNDLSLPPIASMKPLPSSSLSKNLISRIEQFSSPVTRKLKFWNKKSFQVNQYDPSFKVIYLGNLGMQLWSKEESCLEKPLSTLWNNYLVNMKTEIVMRLTICNSGLKAITRQHGLTQYWSNRLVYCCSHKNYPRIFSWVYRHEGKKMRQELRCHAVFCPSPEKATKMATMLNQRLACALQEFKREKKSRGQLVSTTMDSSANYINNDCNNIQEHKQKLPTRTIPLRRQILAKGTANFRPPLERSKSAPKLTSIQEEEYNSDEEGEEDDDDDSGDGVDQQVFEFEESFDGDKDESDYDNEDEIESSKCDLDDGEEITHKFESNSLATSVNEETSNCSSVCATTGDSFYDNKQSHSVKSRTPVKSKSDYYLDDTPKGTGHINEIETHHKRTKESIDHMESPPPHTNEADMVTAESNQIISSANRTHKQNSSSSNQNKGLPNDTKKDPHLETKEDDHKGSSATNHYSGIKNINNNNNDTNKIINLTTGSVGPSTGDSGGGLNTNSGDAEVRELGSEQEIVLPWSNLAIK